jgi:hypothetical protein
MRSSWCDFSFDCARIQMNFSAVFICQDLRGSGSLAIGQEGKEPSRKAGLLSLAKGLPRYDSKAHFCGPGRRRGCHAVHGGLFELDWSVASTICQLLCVLPSSRVVRFSLRPVGARSLDARPHARSSARIDVALLVVTLHAEGHEDDQGRL